MNNRLPFARSTSTVSSDAVTIQGDGSAGSPIAIKAVQHDATLTGNGTVASPLAAVTATAAVVFDGTTNLRGNQSANRSPIDNTKTKIVNLGSQTHLVQPASTGATAIGATIGGGEDNSATGADACVPGGSGCTASGVNAFAAGLLTNAAGLGAVALGFQSTAGGTVAFAHGNQCIASADYAVSMGSQNTASGIDAVTMGIGNVGSGAGSVTFGQNNTNTGANSMIWGTQCFTGSHDSLAYGILADAFRLQSTYAAGAFDQLTRGQAQTTLFVYRGVTPGAAGSESVILLSSGALTQDGPRLQDNKSYSFVITLNVGGTQAGPVQISTTIVLKFTAQRIAGVSVITGSLQDAPIGSAGCATWTLVPTVAAGPDRLVLTFTTGLTATITKAVAHVQMTEAAAF